MFVASLDAVLHQMPLQLLLVGLGVDAVVQHEREVLFVVITHLYLDFESFLQFRVVLRNLEQFLDA